MMKNSVLMAHQIEGSISTANWGIEGMLVSYNDEGRNMLLFVVDNLRLLDIVILRL